jgi:hypothetical protein
VERELAEKGKVVRQLQDELAATIARSERTGEEQVTLVLGQ